MNNLSGTNFSRRRFMQSTTGVLAAATPSSGISAATVDVLKLAYPVALSFVSEDKCDFFSHLAGLTLYNPAVSVLKTGQFNHLMTDEKSWWILYDLFYAEYPRDLTLGHLLNGKFVEAVSHLTGDKDNEIKIHQSAIVLRDVFGLSSHERLSDWHSTCRSKVGDYLAKALSTPASLPALGTKARTEVSHRLLNLAEACEGYCPEDPSRLTVMAGNLNTEARHAYRQTAEYATEQFNAFLKQKKSLQKSFQELQKNEINLKDSQRSLLHKFERSLAQTELEAGTNEQQLEKIDFSCLTKHWPNDVQKHFLAGIQEQFHAVQTFLMHAQQPLPAEPQKPAQECSLNSAIAFATTPHPP